MADFELSVHVGPLADWPDERVAQAWRVISSAVRRISLDADADPAAVARLRSAEQDAEMFGDELIRRGVF